MPSMNSVGVAITWPEARPLSTSMMATMPALPVFNGVRWLPLPMKMAQNELLRLA
jgi:hypothetical protein